MEKCIELVISKNLWRDARSIQYKKSRTHSFGSRQFRTAECVLESVQGNVGRTQQQTAEARPWYIPRRRLWGSNLTPWLSRHTLDRQTLEPLSPSSPSSCHWHGNSQGKMEKSNYLATLRHMTSGNERRTESCWVWRELRSSRLLRSE